MAATKIKLNQLIQDGATTTNQAVVWNNSLSVWQPSTAVVALNGGNSLGAAMMLGTNDSNSLQLETNGVVKLTIDTNGLITTAQTSSNTNTQVNALTLTTDGGSVTAGFGNRILFQAETATVSNRDAGFIGPLWTNSSATDASRTSAMVLGTVNNAGTVNEVVRFQGATVPTMSIASAMGTAGTTTYANNGITNAVSYTIGGTSSSVTIGGSSGNVTLSTSSSTGIFLSASSANVNAAVVVGINTFTHTTGSKASFAIIDSYSPTSGTGIHNFIFVGGGVAQSGGANGITNGISFVQDLTTAANYRAISVIPTVSASSWYGLYIGGTGSKNYLDGNTSIGTTTISEKLRVAGSVRLDLGSDATGDILYRSSGGALSRLGVGSNGDVLTLASGLPSWVTPSGGNGIYSGSDIIPSGVVANITDNFNIDYTTADGFGINNTLGITLLSPDNTNAFRVGDGEIYAQLGASSLLSMYFSSSVQGFVMNDSTGSFLIQDATGVNSISVDGGDASLSSSGARIGANGSEVSVEGTLYSHNKIRLGDRYYTLTGSENDFSAGSILGTTAFLNISPDAAGYSITGLDYTGKSVGDIIIICNFDTVNAFTLTNQDTLSAFGNRFKMHGDLIVDPNSTATFIYDDNGAWRLIGASAGIGGGIYGGSGIIPASTVATTTASSYFFIQNSTGNFGINMVDDSTLRLYNPDNTGSIELDNNGITISVGTGDSIFIDAPNMYFNPGTSGNINIGGSGGDRSTLFLFENFANGTNYVAFRAASSISTNATYTFPSAPPGANGYVLSSTTAGVWSWVNPSTLGSSIYTGSGTIASGTNATITAASTFGINYSSTDPAILFADATGSILLQDSSTVNQISLLSTGVTLTATGNNIIMSSTGTLFNTKADFQNAFLLSSDASPTQITANQNDYNPATLATVSRLRLDASAAWDITGLQGGADGRVIVIDNIGSFAITLKNSDTGSSSANRFLFTADLVLAANESVTLVYDGTSTKWRAAGVGRVTASGGGSSTWNGITNPTGTQSLTFDDGELTAWTINSDTETFHTYTANSLTTGKLVQLNSSSLTSGSLLDINVTGTGAASNTQKGLNISTSGANASSTQTTYGGYISNTHTGTSSTNVGLYSTASGGTNNYAAIFEAGRVGIGTTAPTVTLDARGTTATTNAVQDQLLLATSLTTGTVAGGFGTGILFQGTANNAGTPSVLRDMGNMGFVWQIATDGSRTADAVFYNVNSGTAASETARFIAGSPPALLVASSMGTKGTTQYRDAGIVNSSVAFTLGGSSQTVTVSSASTSTSAVLLNTTGNASSITIGNQAYTSGGLAKSTVTFSDSYTAASGSGTHTAIEIANTINLTSSASGASIGIDISPTLTSLTAATYRGINIGVSHANSFGIYQSSTTPKNVFAGKNTFGTTTAGSEVMNITGNMVVTGQYVSKRFALTDGGTIALNWNNGNDQSVTIAGNRTFTFANPIDGGRYLIKLKQDATGSRTITWPTITWKGGTAPTLTTTANKTDFIYLYYDGTSYFGSSDLNF